MPCDIIFITLNGFVLADFWLKNVTLRRASWHARWNFCGSREFGVWVKCLQDISIIHACHGLVGVEYTESGRVALSVDNNLTTLLTLVDKMENIKNVERIW